MEMVAEGSGKEPRVETEKGRAVERVVVRRSIRMTKWRLAYTHMLLCSRKDSRWDQKQNTITFYLIVLQVTAATIDDGEYSL